MESNIVGTLACAALAGDVASLLILADYLEENPGRTQLAHLSPDALRQCHNVHKSPRLLRVLQAVGAPVGRKLVQELVRHVGRATHMPQTKGGKTDGS